ncbi:MAG: HPr family phosphocarrier protein [Clostridia bacterium]|nr:HPr family phosphocarrier protein [Clostridia bacterium]MDY3785213.1 HPr family phosphocarrier protein [Eubacteriales bacterium]
MKDLYIKLNTISDVRDFVNAVNSINGDIDLTSGRYTVDGKSIMGIFSLDLMNPIKLTAHTTDENELLEKLGKFICEK